MDAPLWVFVAPFALMALVVCLCVTAVCLCATYALIRWAMRI